MAFLKIATFLVTFLFAINSWAGACDIIIKKPSEVIEINLDSLHLNLRQRGGLLTLNFTFDGNARRPDWSLASAIIFAVGAKNAMFKNSILKASVDDLDGALLASLQNLAIGLEALVARDQAPESLREVGNFERPSRLEKFQDEIGLGSMTPTRFRSLFSTVFSQYAQNLPSALVVAFRSEYFLAATIEPDAVPAQIVRASYGIGGGRAVQALEQLRAAFIRSLLAGDGQIVISPARFGLVPHEHTIPLPLLARTIPSPSPFDREVGIRTFDQYENLSPTSTAHAHSYDYLGPNEERNDMIDELPYEIIDLEIIIKFRNLGIHTVYDLATRVTGHQLMYEIGLDRNQIRDLYYYFLQNYKMHLRLGEEFAITLRIFRPEFRRPYLAPKPFVR